MTSITHLDQGHSENHFAGPSDNLSERQEHLSEGEKAFVESMQKLSADVKEVADGANEIEAAGRNLVRELEIGPGLFKNRANTLFMCSLAKSCAELERNRSAMARDAYIGEKTFIFDSAALLAKRHSGRFEQLKQQVMREGRPSDEVAVAAYDKFTNVQVTHDLKDAIAKGLLDDVKKRLKISDDNEDDYELHVLNVASKESLGGMKPGVTSRERVQMADQVGDMLLFEDYAAGLRKKSVEFMAMSGMPSIPLAWSEVMADGSRHLIITLPTAEKLLYPDEPRGNNYSEEDRLLELALVEHEYAHIQGESLMPDHNIAFGLVFEEPRVELAAGSKLGYQDAKGFVFIDLQVLTGLDFKASIEAAEKGGAASQLWVALANVVGLRAALEISLIIPGSYMDEAASMQRSVNMYLGRYDGVCRRLYERQSPEAREKTLDFIKRLANTLKYDSHNEAWRRTRSIMYGLSYVTAMIDEEIARLEASS